MGMGIMGMAEIKDSRAEKITYSPKLSQNLEPKMLPSSMEISISKYFLCLALSVIQRKAFGHNQFVHNISFRYYGYRNPSSEPDLRLKCFSEYPELFRDRDVLDIGCNVGHITLSVWFNAVVYCYSNRFCYAPL